MKYLPFLFLLILLSACNNKQATIELQVGDLLFRSNSQGLGGAIEEVTQGFEGYDFSHVGMVFADSSHSLQVIEATDEVVQITTLDSFLQKGSAIFVGRVKDEYQPLLSKAIAFSLAQLGKPYDEEYLYDNGKYYCSELIYDAFLFANNGRPFFQLEPMTFKVPETGKFSEGWVIHYQKLGIAIPEGEPGCNPGGLSHSDKIKVTALKK